MDYFLWDEVERRMTANKPAGKESVAGFKARRWRVIARSLALDAPPRPDASCLLRVQ